MGGRVGQASIEAGNQDKSQRRGMTAGGDSKTPLRRTLERRSNGRKSGRTRSSGQFFRGDGLVKLCGGRTESIGAQPSPASEVRGV